MKQKNTKQKPYWEMTADELAEATKEFDKPLDPKRFKPLTKAQRAEFEKVRRAGGLRAIRIYSFAMDDALFSQVMNYSKRKGISVSKLIERGVRGVLAFGD